MSEKPERRIHLVVLIFGVVLVIYSITTVAQSKLLTKSVTTYTVNSYQQECQILTDTFADLMGAEMGKYIKQLRIYTNQEIVKNGTSEQILDWFLREGRALRSEDFEYVAFVNEKGEFYGDNDSTTNILDRDYFKKIMQEGADEFVSSAALSKTTGRNIVHLCKAVNHKGKNIGFFTAIIDVDRLQDRVNELVLGETGVAVICAGDGSFVATSGDYDSIMSLMGDTSKTVTDRLAENMSLLAKGQGGEYWITFPSSKKTVYNVFRPVPDTQWSIFFMIEKEQIYEAGKMVEKGIGIMSAIAGFILLFTVAVLIGKSLKPLAIVNDNITEIATGNADLTKRINIKNNTEIGSVVDGFNLFTRKLQDIVLSLKNSKTVLTDTGVKLNESTSNTSSAITQITACIENLGSNITHQTASVVETSTAINQISANIESLNKMVVTQSSNVTEASAAVTEMISNINSVNRSVERMAASFEDLENRSVEGVKKQGDVNDRIRLIEEESETLQEANAVISNIAEQTNLLAMNAAIEAAHAGESGKGFSVVADEIRKLSETSSAQSKTIGTQLQKIVDSINGIVSASKEAQISFTSVSSGISSTDGVVQEIKNAMMEQEEGSQQITLALKNMTDSTSEVTNASTEMAEGARAILDEIKNLQDNTASMKQAMDEMSIGAKKINQTGATLHELSGLVSDSITDIGKQVDKFTV